ncbi:MAG: DUF2800 domain-containing protein [Coriobacteriia bacterium]|nr:DUF2800 domain-containing protein [Coriobacteriia bacterium]
MVDTLKHALLSPSSAYRWLVCPPSARLSEGIPDEESEYAAEGSVAHRLLSVELNKRLDLGIEGVESKVAVTKSRYYNAEMQDYIDKTVNLIEEIKNSIGECHILLDKRLDISRWVPESFGTADVVIASPSTICVIDFKYGQGIRVTAEKNPQTRLYALGAWYEFNDRILFDIDVKVQMIVIQPRLDLISEEYASLGGLMVWAGIAKEKAEQAFAGVGEFNPSAETCQFCAVKATCPSRSETAITIANGEMPELLTVADVASVLPKLEVAQKWIKDVLDWVLEQAVAGVEIPGYALTYGRSNRAFSDSEAVTDALRRAKDIKKADYTEERLLSLASLEKNLGKKRFTELLGEYVVKPQGRPKLTPVSAEVAEVEDV